MSHFDLKLTFNNDLMEADLLFLNNDIVTDDGLETAIIISLFTDRRASIEDDLPDKDNLDLRGWWGDSTSEKDNDKIGSLLWLLERSKTEQDIINKAELYAKDALQWLIDEGIATEVIITVESIKVSNAFYRFDLLVEIFRGQNQLLAVKHEHIWEGTLNAS